MEMLLLTEIEKKKSSLQGELRVKLDALHWRPPLLGAHTKSSVNPLLGVICCFISLKDVGERKRSFFG